MTNELTYCIQIFLKQAIRKLENVLASNVWLFIFICFLHSVPINGMHTRRNCDFKFYIIKIAKSRVSEGQTIISNGKQFVVITKTCLLQPLILT